MKTGTRLSCLTFKQGHKPLQMGLDFVHAAHLRPALLGRQVQIELVGGHGLQIGVGINVDRAQLEIKAHGRDGMFFVPCLDNEAGRVGQQRAGRLHGAGEFGTHFLGEKVGELLLGRRLLHEKRLEFVDGQTAEGTLGVHRAERLGRGGREQNEEAEGHEHAFCRGRRMRN